MLCIAYAQSAYDYARLMWIAVGKQCALPGGIFSRYNNLIFAVLPALLYGLEACPANSADKSSLEFAHTRLLLTLYRTRSNVINSESNTASGLRALAELISGTKMIS